MKTRIGFLMLALPIAYVMVWLAVEMVQDRAWGALSSYVGLWVWMFIAVRLIVSTAPRKPDD